VYIVEATGEVHEYCHFETFRARCPRGDVVLMQSAYYGRKSLGRCVRTNFGFIGCYTDVLEMMDRRCTGRTSCDVDVIEPNFDDIRPCNVELKSYLQANYICIGGTTLLHCASLAAPRCVRRLSVCLSRPVYVKCTSICIAHFYAKRLKCAQTWITQFYLQITPCLPLLPSRRTSPPFGWYSFYRSTEGRRLSRLIITRTEILV